LRKKYPYYIIPKLTGKHPLAKLIHADEEFYENRKRQLNYYINYLANHEYLNETKDFISFINEAQFDEGLFLSDEGIYDFPHCAKVTDNMKSRIMGVFSNLFGYKEEVRKMSDNEIQIKRMENHYKNVFKKYREILQNMMNYSKTIQSQSTEHRNLSKICYFLKDTFMGNEEKADFKNFHVYSNDLYVVNRKYYVTIMLDLKNKLEVRILNIGLQFVN
jgi:hypothetical protein